MNKELLNKLKDPMVIILCVLLLFLTFGSLLGGCSKPTVIALDSAYGGDNTGYVGIINESDFTANVVEKLAQKLNEDKHFKVILTHEKGESSSVEERAALLNDNQPDFVLSIHASGSPVDTKSGQRIYADIPTDKNHETSLKLANEIAKAFTDDSWNPTVGYLYYKPYADNSYEIVEVNQDDTNDYQLETWSLMQKAEVPVVISDQIYVTSQSDVDKWANEDGYEAAAEKYYQAIKAYYGLN